MATTKKITAGLYATTDGRFQIQRVDPREWGGEGSVVWHLYEQDEDGHQGEYCSSYATKADAVAATERI